MADILQTLKLQSDPSTNVYPNILEGNIPSSAVTTDKVANGNITTVKIADEAITTDKLEDDSVTVDKLNITSATLATLIGGGTSKTALSNLIALRLGSSGHVRFRVSSSSYVGDILFATHPTSHDVYYNMGASGWVTISTDSDAATFIAAWGTYIRDYYVG